MELLSKVVNKILEYTNEECKVYETFGILEAISNIIDIKGYYLWKKELVINFNLKLNKTSSYHHLIFYLPRKTEVINKQIDIGISVYCNSYDTFGNNTNVKILCRGITGTKLFEVLIIPISSNKTINLEVYLTLNYNH